MYKFSYTERTNEKATEFETKSLLYLLSMNEDSNEMDIFLIDCFNDVTGTNMNCDKLWDIQSKGIRSLNPKKIGGALITLFENYISDINFYLYILFFPKINNIYFINDTLTVFGIENFKENHIQKLKSGLLEEYINRHSDEKISDSIQQQIEVFLNEVHFVIAEDSKCKYIKKIMNLKKSFKKSDEFFNSIFDDIRDKQSVLKNICIHAKEIKEAREVLNFKKFLRKQDIEMLIVDRIIGTNIFKNKRVPIGFMQYVEGVSQDEVRNIIQECDSEVSLMLFNNSDKKNFWIFFEKIYFLIKNNMYSDINCIFDKVKNEKLIKNKVLSEVGTKYFISLIEEGVKNENN